MPRGPNRKSPALASIVVSPTSKVAALEDPERLVLAVVHVCSGAAAFGGSVISSTLSRPPVSSEVTLISASEPNHHLASPSPWGVATGVSTCVSCVMCPPIGLRPR